MSDTALDVLVVQLRTLFFLLLLFNERQGEHHRRTQTEKNANFREQGHFELLEVADGGDGEEEVLDVGHTGLFEGRDLHADGVGGVFAGEGQEDGEGKAGEEQRVKA